MNYFTVGGLFDNVAATVLLAVGALVLIAGVIYAWRVVKRMMYDRAENEFLDRVEYNSEEARAERKYYEDNPDVF